MRSRFPCERAAASRETTRQPPRSPALRRGTGQAPPPPFGRDVAHQQLRDGRLAPEARRLVDGQLHFFIFVLNERELLLDEVKFVFVILRETVERHVHRAQKLADGRIVPSDEKDEHERTRADAEQDAHRRAEVDGCDVPLKFPVVDRERIGKAGKIGGAREAGATTAFCTARTGWMSLAWKIRKPSPRSRTS